MPWYDHTLEALLITIVKHALSVNSFHLLNWIKENTHSAFDEYISMDDDRGYTHVDTKWMK